MKLALSSPGASVLSSAAACLTSRRVFALLACYFLLQAVLRAVVSDSAELDESHQVLCAQTWQWGYGSDPPLYTWLQILVFQVVGTNVLGLALLKNALLFSAFFFTYLAARAITGDERTSLFAMLSLLLFPQITWESQRDLTHSVLATALAAATFVAALRVSRSRAPTDYLLLGVCLGLGTLSKYSYCLFALALTMAALSVPAFRRVVLSRWILLTLAAWTLLTAIHFRWVLLSPEVALVRSEQVLKNIDARPIIARAVGVLSVVKCIVMLGAVISAAYLIAFSGKATAQGIAVNAAVHQWLRRTLLIVLGMALTVALGTGVELKDRWFQPVAFLIAISAVLLVQNRLTAQAERRFTWVVGSLAALALIVLPGVPLAASITKRPTRLNAPYSTLAPQLRAAVGNPAMVVAATRLVGGNMRLNFPESRVISPEFQALSLRPDLPWLVVWDATKSTAPARPLRELITKLTGANLTDYQPTYFEANFKYTRAKKMRLGCVTLPANLVHDPSSSSSGEKRAL